MHRIAIGQTDLSGDDFGSIFAHAVEGTHRASPLGIADVIWGECAWSVKTVKTRKPLKATKVRLISGRNAPDYSIGISDPRSNVEKTGKAVLSIWNARVDEALAEYRDLRVVVLIRNVETREFLIFEEEGRRFPPNDFNWEINVRGNFEAKDRTSGTHRFTWQPHGGQFTIIQQVTGSA